MSETDFVPLNDLEHALSNVANGHIDFEKFLKVFLDSEVFVLTATEVQADGTGLRPLLLERDNQTRMAVFTAWERVEPFKHHCRFCLQTNGRYFLRVIPQDVGLVLNPGSRLGFEVPAQGVQDIRRDFEVSDDDPNE